MFKKFATKVQRSISTVNQFPNKRQQNNGLETKKYQRSFSCTSYQSEPESLSDDDIRRASFSSGFISQPSSEDNEEFGANNNLSEHYAAKMLVDLISTTTTKSSGTGPLITLPTAHIIISTALAEFGKNHKCYPLVVHVFNY